MKCDQNPSATDNSSSIESLLCAAADYEPDAPMPLHIEARALSRITRLRGMQQRGQVILATCCIALTAMLGRYALTRTTHLDAGPGEPVAALGSRSPNGLPSPDRNVHVPTVAPRGTMAARTRVDLAHSIIADHRRAYGNGNRHGPAGTVMVRVRGLANRQTQRHYPRVARMAAPGVYRVWRTEVVETDTAGYFAPAVLAKPDEEHGTLTITAAAVAIPVRTMQAIFREPEYSDHRGTAAGPDSSTASHNVQNSGEYR
jgi:hypothetical protein